MNKRLNLLHGKDPGATPGADSYPLLCHLIDTVVVADLLWEHRIRPGLRLKLGELLGSSGLTGTASDEAESIARATVLYAAGMHDIGKANPFFQYQERFMPSPDWQELLANALGLPGTGAELSAYLRVRPKDALRRHEFISHRILAGRWARDTDRLSSDEWLAIVVGGHHGYWRSPNADVDMIGTPLVSSGWDDHQLAVVAAVDAVITQRTGVARDQLSAPKAGDAAVALALVSGLLTEADWIASDDTQVFAGKELLRGGVDPHESPQLALEWVKSRTRSLTEHVDRSLGPTPSLRGSEITQQILGSYQPRPLQVQAMELPDLVKNTHGGPPDPIDSGLWIVMYPTGDGKTEAAGLRHAHQPEEGLLFGLPTRATTDAMESRLDAWLSPLGAQLVKSHQFAELQAEGQIPHDSDNDDLVGDSCCGSGLWYTNALRKLAAPNIVATCDQVLAGALRQRHLMMRLFNLANHHVVLDEVHTFDTYQTELLVELLAWWGATNTRVTLLSATLPRDQLDRMVRAYRSGVGADPDEKPPAAVFPGSVFVPSDPALPVLSLAPVVTGNRDRRLPPVRIETVTLGSRKQRVAEHLSWAADLVVQHPDSPIGIVANVVDDCIEIAEHLAGNAAIASSHEVLCLHSRMVVRHRAAKESYLLSRIGKAQHEAGFDHTQPHSRPLMVVATQVIQASLDIDVDFLSSDLAPAPDLIQRLGRQWRFEVDPEQISASRMRRTGSSERRFKLIAVTEEDGRTPTRRGALPYLGSSLHNTLGWVIDTLGMSANSILDVVASSQEWVDRAFDRVLFAAFTEDDVQLADDRLALDATHVQAALEAKAKLSAFGAQTRKGLLRRGAASSKRAGATWHDLVLATERNQDEATMRTRFIDRESLTLALFDQGSVLGDLSLGAGSSPLMLGECPPALEEFSPKNAIPILGNCIAIPISLFEIAELELAAALTLGRSTWSRDDWAPRAALLRGVIPVDIKYLPGAAYSAATGLQIARTSR